MIDEEMMIDREKRFHQEKLCYQQSINPTLDAILHVPADDAPQIPGAPLAAVSLLRQRGGDDRRE